MNKIVIIGEGEALLSHLQALDGEGAVEIETAADGYQALELVETFRPAVVFIASGTVGLDCTQLLLHLKEIDPDVETICVLDAGAADRAVEALELGASDVIPRPLSYRAVKVALRRARDKIWMRRRLQEALEEIQRRHDFEFKLIQTSMDGIIANDRQGKIIVFNEGASRIYGYTTEEALSRIHVTQLYPQGEARRIKKNIYGPDYGGARRLINYETLALAKDGRLVPILLSATLIYDGEAEVATVGYFKDLTNFRR